MPRGIGDTVFNPNGNPGVVTERNLDSGKLKIETEGPTLRATQKRAYINGLNVEERSRFNEIVDRVNEIKDPKEREAELVKVIGEVGDDPRHLTVKRYLDAELTHLRISHNIRPRTYQLDGIYARD